MILAVSPRNDLYLAAEQGQGAVEWKGGGLVLVLLG